MIYFLCDCLRVDAKDVVAPGEAGNVQILLLLIVIIKLIPSLSLIHEVVIFL